MDILHGNEHIIARCEGAIFRVRVRVMHGQSKIT
jgi:hypothetical protein